MSAASFSEPGPTSISGCELLQSVSAELALGSLTGSERSAALAHVDDCQPCRQLVEELTAAADSLLLIAPEADPPAGFEVRLLERLHASGGTSDNLHAASAALVDSHVAGAGDTGTTVQSAPVISLAAGRGRSGRSGRRLAPRARVALAAVAVAAAGVGLGLEVAPRPAPSVAAIGHVRFSSLHAGSGRASSSDAAAGEVVITGGRPSWLLMTVDIRATGWVTCEVVVNGRQVPVGTFELYNGRGSWTARLRQSGAAITSARIVDSSGRVLASAAFPV